MENSEEKNLLQGSITDRLPGNISAFYKRDDAGKDVTVKNDGPGDIKCSLFREGAEDPSSGQREIRAGYQQVFDSRGDTLIVQTGYESAAFTIGNAKRR